MSLPGLAYGKAKAVFSIRHLISKEVNLSEIHAAQPVRIVHWYSVLGRPIVTPFVKGYGFCEFRLRWRSRREVTLLKNQQLKVGIHFLRFLEGRLPP